MTNEYIIQYSDMEDKITDQAAQNVLQLERFGCGDTRGLNENGGVNSAGGKYKIFRNDCNSFTRAVFKEYRKLWKLEYSRNNPDASKIEIWKAWRNHKSEITKRRGEVYYEK